MIISADNRRRQMPGASAFVITPKRGEPRTGKVCDVHAVIRMRELRRLAALDHFKRYAAPFVLSGHNISPNLTPIYKRSAGGASGFAVNLNAHTVDLDITRPIGGSIVTQGACAIRHTDAATVPNNVYTVSVGALGTRGSVTTNTQTLVTTIDGTVIANYLSDQVPQAAVYNGSDPAGGTSNPAFPVYSAPFAQAQFNTPTREWIDQLTPAANSGTFEIRVSALGGSNVPQLGVPVGTWANGIDITLFTATYVPQDCTTTVQVRDAVSLLVLASVTHSYSNDMHT